MSIFDTIAAKVMPPESAEDRAEARRQALALSRGPDDWLTLVIEQHRQIEQLLEAARSGRDAAARRDAARNFATLITGHALAEEMVLYPMLADDHKGHTEKAYQEHVLVKIEMHKLEMLDPMSEDWLEKVNFIHGAVQHHIYEEEGTYVPELREALGDDDAVHSRRFREEFEKYVRGAESGEHSKQMMMAESSGA